MCVFVCVRKPTCTCVRVFIIITRLDTTGIGGIPGQPHSRTENLWSTSTGEKIKTNTHIYDGNISIENSKTYKDDLGDNDNAISRRIFVNVRVSVRYRNQTRSQTIKEEKNLLSRQNLPLREFGIST